MQKKPAFSLIELSIVLIIIGFLVAAILGGKSLIKSYQLRSIVSEAKALAISVNSFYSQYGAYPGDYTGTIGGAASGNGDEKINYCAASGCAASDSEGRNAWIMLKGVGMLEASAIGATSPTGTDTPTIFGPSGFAPASLVQGSGWEIDYRSSDSQNVVVLTGTPLAAASPANTLVNGSSLASPAITVSDALSIDSKIDDGVANTGRVQPINEAAQGAYAECSVDEQYMLGRSDEKLCAVAYQIRDSI